MSRRNLVFIMSDQQRRDSMGCYGSGWAQTPNLDALASSGYIFENAYVTQPVCTPARASIMTGLYPHTAGPIVNKLPLSPDVPVLAEMVSEEYVCGYMGKWHLGDDVIKQHGFDVWTSTEDYHRESYTRREHRRVLSDYHHHLVANGFEPDVETAGDMVFSPDARARLPEELQMASFLAERAEQFIGHNRDRPFILYVSTFEPHSPYDGPFDGQYEPDLLPVGPAFLKRPEGAALVNRVRADYFMQYLHDGDISEDAYMRETLAPGHDLSTEAGWRRLRAQYYGNVTLVDGMVGRIRSALELAGIADDTAVVFTTEHGDMLGDHGMLEKRSFYEESSRVPLLMRVPWLSSGRRSVEGSAGHVDLVPTLLDLLGEPLPHHLEGRSLVPVLRGEETLDDNDVFIEWNGTSPTLRDRFLGSESINRMLALPYRSVVSDRWKLNLCAGDQGELFDLRADPYEQTNLFDDPAQRDRVRDMAARIRMWQYGTGDSAPLPAV